MRLAKFPGLFVVVLSVLAIFSTSASAAALTPSSGEGAPFDAIGEGGHVLLANQIANVTCSSTIEGAISKWSPASILVNSVAFTGCTNSWHVTTLKGSAIPEIHYKAAGEGTLTSTALEIDTTRLGVTCVYLTSATSIGTLTDSDKTKGTATLDISASIPLEPVTSSGLCGSGNAKWEGAYSVTQPDPLYIDQ